MEAENNPGFLPFFFQEPVYVINEPESFNTEPQDETHFAPTIEEISVKGENKKEILVLVQEKNTEFISPANEQLLIKILQAVKLSMDDIALVNLSNITSLPPSHIAEALEKIPFHTLISFGAVVKEWSVSNFFSKYMVNTDDTNRNILLADTLDELASDLQKKRSLWQCLQKLFSD